MLSLTAAADQRPIVQFMNAALNNEWLFALVMMLGPRCDYIGAIGQSYSSKTNY